MSCGRFTDDLSGFVDQTLPPTRWEQVGYHVAGCESCREQVAEIRDLQQRLRSGNDQVHCSTSLAARLEQIAGDGCHSPLYMTCRSGSSQLPTRRASARRHMAALGAAAVAGAATMIGAALLLATDLPRVGNPVKQARQHYSLSLTAINVNPAVGAVLMAHENGAVAPESTSLRPRGGVHGMPRRMSAAEADALLTREALTFSGIQRVWVSDGEGGFSATDVHLDEAASGGVRLEVLDAQGKQFKAWFVPGEGCCRNAGAPSDWKFLRYPGPAEVAGRTATVVEAREEGHLVARWWVDSETGLLLWSERYDGHGSLLIVSGFTELRLGEANVDPADAELVVMEEEPGTRPENWCIGLATCPEVMADLPLVAHSSSGNHSMNLVYSDGFRNLTVTWKQGVLHDDLGTHVDDETPGYPRVSAWQAGNGVVSVTTNGGAALAERARRDLPAEEPWEPSLLDRCVDGLGRLLGSN